MTDALTPISMPYIEAPLGFSDQHGPSMLLVTAPVLKRGVGCPRIKGRPMLRKQAVAVIIAAKQKSLVRIERECLSA
jgi:hypothetical protein